MFPKRIEKTKPNSLPKVQAARPAILGALFEAVSEGLRRESIISLPRLPRMAAFAKWGAAFETVFWPQGTFMSAYYANRDSAVEDVIEGDKVVAALRAFMAAREDRWEGTASELLLALVKHVKQPEIEAESLYQNEKTNDNNTADAEAPWREARARTRETLAAGWPKAPHKLTGRLRLASDALRKAGVEVAWPSRHGDRKVIAIARVPRH
jgi:hypothetical protein